MGIFNKKNEMNARMENLETMATTAVITAGTALFVGIVNSAAIDNLSNEVQHLGNKVAETTAAKTAAINAAVAARKASVEASIAAKKAEKEAKKRTA